jgi:hypothetical protein
VQVVGCLTLYLIFLHGIKMKIITTNVSWYNTATKTSKGNYSCKEPHPRLLPYKRGAGAEYAQPKLNQKNLEIQIRVQNLLHTPAPGPSYGWIKFPTVLCTGWSPLGSSTLHNVLSPRWFESNSHGNHKIHSQRTHYPQRSPPTHGSQYADDSCVLHGEEMPAGPRFRSGRDDL